MGGVCRQSWKFFESKAVSSKVERNAEMVILLAFLVCGVSVWYLETQKLLPKACYTSKTHAHLLLSWNTKKIEFRPILGR